MGIYRNYVKRILDFILSLFAIIILSPVYLLIALCVRVKIGCPIIFKQDRPGKNEKIFQIYKFRTMTDEKDSEGNLLPVEMRLTAFGRKLRSTSLDELPQLFNILKGDMSFIGPRPLLVQYLPYYTDKERYRHDIRPGLTGLAQIEGRNLITWDKIFEFDIKYVSEVSFFYDVQILFKTIIKVIGRQDIEDVSQVNDISDNGIQYNQPLDKERNANAIGNRE